MKRGFLCGEPARIGEPVQVALRGAPQPGSLGKIIFLFTPSADGVDENLLLLFHGRGDRAAPFKAFASKLALPQTASLSVEGTLAVPYSDGGRSWFDAFADDGELLPSSDPRRWTTLRATVDTLELALQKLHAAWPWRKLHLFGFSDGATAALELSLRFRGERSLGSCTSVSGSLLPESLSGAFALQREARCAPLASLNTPVLLTRGEEDDVLPLELALASQELLRRLAPGCGAELVRVEGKGHSMPRSSAEMRGLMAHWSHTLSWRPDEDAVEMQ
jgi:predicted esterase